MIKSRAEACNILGVSIYADSGEIKRAYRNLVKIYHPDAGMVNSTAKYNELVMAFEYLMANPYESPIRTAKIIGGKSRKGADYDTFQRKMEAQRNARAQQFEEKIAAYNKEIEEQEKEYQKAMDAINAIRIAEAIKAIIENSKKD